MMQRTPAKTVSSSHNSEKIAHIDLKFTMLLPVRVDLCGPWACFLGLRSPLVDPPCQITRTRVNQRLDPISADIAPTIRKAAIMRGTAFSANPTCDSGFSARRRVPA
jgi:hypothetical protein